MRESEPGREMDALVAERVMRLVPCTDPLGKCDAAKTNPIQCWGTGGGGSELKSYSTDIADAWLVVERMGELGFALDLTVGVALSYSVARFRNAFGTGPCADRNTPPAVICIAALKTVKKLQ